MSYCPGTSGNRASGTAWISILLRKTSTTVPLTLEAVPYRYVLVKNVNSTRNTSNDTVSPTTVARHS